MSSLPEFKRKRDESATVKNYGGAFSTSGMAAGRRNSDKQFSLSQFSLSGTQLVVMWSILAACFCAAFLFGLFAGREQGVAIALEEYQRQATRLPIVQPLSNLGSGEALPDIDQEIGRLASSADKRSGQQSVATGAAGADKVSDDAAEPAKTPADPASAADFSPESKITLRKKTENAETEQQGVEADSAAPVVRSGKPETPQTLSKDSISTNPDKVPGKISDGSGAREVSELAPGWYVQVGASREKEKAVELAQKLHSAGLNTLLGQAVVKKQRFYQVLLGPHDNKQKAEVAKSKAVNSAKLSVSPFLKRISG